MAQVRACRNNFCWFIGNGIDAPGVEEAATGGISRCVLA
jgi:hypothetical protein